MRPTRLRRPAAALLATALLTACAATPDAGPSPTTTDPGASDAPAVTIPDTPVGTQTRWVLDTLAGDGPTTAEARERFAQVFLDQVPAEQVATVFVQLRGMGPFRVESYEEDGDAGRAMLRGADDARYSMDIAVDGDGRMVALFLAPAAPVPTISGPAEAADALAPAAPYSSLLLASVDGEGDDARCVDVEAKDADAQHPIGSMFKLYVAGAVARGVAEGTLTWDDELTLTEELRSLPSGTLQLEPPGTRISVRRAAEQMIAISDNTATDLLIEAVGRDAVERVLTEMGASEPSANIPFLTPREAFQLALSDPRLLADWTAASGLPADVATAPRDQDASTAVDDAQRAVLADLPAWDLTVHPAAGATAFWPAGVDWFATARDLCAAHVDLQRLAATESGAPLREILSANPGIDLPGAAYVGFKGGSSVGEIGGSWYVERADGAREVLVTLTAGGDAAAVPDAGWLMGVSQQALGGAKPQ